MTALLLALDAQLLDGATWILAVNARGIGGESNPFAQALGGQSLAAVLAVKLVGALVLALLAWRLRDRRVALLPAIVGVVGACTNLAAL